ncbi:SPRY domain-containing SOCS box protein 2 [Rhinatrema bivittatum]|uniref:SPRY domain-containing SOCS box protein 2 n=1 Tax=Rhinatrema bivittatum TaxID=194408 RepID=UPI00112CABC8|nr:SPRY domain-containing SOCS box protein 2 [Rhinatrema bivittatum]
MGQTITNVQPLAPPEPIRPEGLEELLAEEPAETQAQLENGWNCQDCSDNLTVKEEGLAVWRRPLAQLSDGVRGKKGYSEGLHAWEISWPVEQRGTHAMVGVATSHAPLQADCYTSLLGSTADSWAWNISTCQLCHSSKAQPATAYPAAQRPSAMAVPEKLVVVLDMVEGTLGYVVDGEYLGTAFQGLRGQTLYPAISAVWGQCEVRIRYIGQQKGEPLSLVQLCRQSIRAALGEGRISAVQSLPLPRTLKKYLLYP